MKLRNRKHGLSRRDMQLLRTYWQEQCHIMEAHKQYVREVWRTRIDADSMASPGECEQ